jgi:hypothetical protein
MSTANKLRRRIENRNGLLESNQQNVAEVL